MKSIIFTTLFLCSIKAHSQVKIIDEAHNPIPYAYIISSRGVVEGISDLNGNIAFDKNNTSVHERDSIEISHISYKRKKLIWNDFISKKQISLIENKLTLKDVIVRAKKTDEYLVLKGYFRSYQLNGKIPCAFMDGIVECFILVNKKSNRLRLHLIENRTFRNPDLYDLKLKRNGGTAGDRTGPSYIISKNILSELEGYRLIDSTDLDCKILYKNDTIGKICNNVSQNQFKVVADVISPKRSYSRSLMDYHVKFVWHTVTEIYKKTAGTVWDNQSNLLTHIEYQNQMVSQGTKMKPVQVESIHEFYVLEKRYIQKSEIKNINMSGFTGPRGTKLVSTFWEKLEEQGIPETPDYINKLLGKTLVMY